MLLVVGCGSGMQPAPVPDADADPLETARVAILICTSGMPGEPTCPMNTLGLGVADASLGFVAQALGTSLYVTDITFFGGTSGLHVEHPTFLFWADEPFLSAPDPELVLDVAPGSSTTLSPLSVIGEAPSKLSVRFDALGPFR